MADDLIHEGIILNKYSIFQQVSDDVDINIGKVEKLLQMPFAGEGDVLLRGL